MKIIGHPWIKSEEFYRVIDIEDIKKTPPNSTILLSTFNIDIVLFCQKNLLPLAVEIESIKDAIFSNLLEVKYIVCSKELAKEIIPIAENYLFDTQLLAKISEDSEIEDMAKIGVDGVIYFFKIK